MTNVNMIFGAPGCGKTTRLLFLLESLLQVGLPPEEIAFVSFTKKGCYEGRDRAIQKFNLTEKNFPYFRTLHSLAFRELNVSKYEMISKKDYKKFGQALGMSFAGYFTEDFINSKDDKYLFFCSLEKNNPAKANQIKDLDLEGKKFSWVKENYARYKKEIGILDFDDLLLNFVQRNLTIPVKVVFIDEAQDLTTLQWRFCDTAFKNCNKVYVGGDDDQAIYEWNGADVHHFLQLSKISRSIEILDKSYRLKSNILKIAKGISKQINYKIEKNFSPASNGGVLLFYNDFKQVQINNEESYYFLSRNTYHLNQFKSHLMNLGVVFFYKNKISVSIALYKAILLYENLRKRDVFAVDRELKLLPYLKKDRVKGASWNKAFALTIEEKDYYFNLFNNNVTLTDIHNCKIRVSTIHGVKGGEADNVIFTLDITKRVYETLNKSEEDYDSELRCIYVALTRTKKNLYIIDSKSKFGYDSIIKEAYNCE